MEIRENKRTGYIIIMLFPEILHLPKVYSYNYILNKKPAKIHNHVVQNNRISTTKFTEKVNIIETETKFCV